MDVVEDFNLIFAGLKSECVVLLYFVNPEDPALVVAIGEGDAAPILDEVMGEGEVLFGMLVYFVFFFRSIWLSVAVFMFSRLAACGIESLSV